MRDRRLQVHSLFFIQAAGCFLIPILLFLLLYLSGSFHDNYTGLLQNENWRILFSVFSIFCLGFALFLLHRIDESIHTRHLIILSVLILAAIVIPYSSHESILSSLHILAAYAAFLYFNWLLFRILIYHARLRSIYTAMLFLCALLCFSASSITGLAEMLYGACTSIVLTSLYTKKHSS